MESSIAIRPLRLRWPRTRSAKARVVDRAIDALRQGQVIAFPTDTVYGLGALGAAAAEKLWRIKQRPPERAIAALVDSIEMAESVAELDPRATVLLRRCWPGPLTVVLRKRGHQDETIGLRMPDYPVPLAIIGRLGAPLATTSANLSGGKSPTTAEEVLAQLAEGYPLLIDAGPCPGGVDSTVIDLTGEQPMLLRAGGLSMEMVERSWSR